MRITGGVHRSRVLQSPAGNAVRPTKDKVRQALYNSLASRGLPDEDTIVLDAFCGTGALGLEALSRGAAHGIFMDKARDSIAICTKNINTLGVGENCTILHKDSTKPGEKPSTIPAANLVFLDPPYRQGLVSLALMALAAGGWMNPGALCVVESEEGDSTVYNGLVLLDQRLYGQTQICVYCYRPG